MTQSNYKIKAWLGVAFQVSRRANRMIATDQLVNIRHGDSRFNARGSPVLVLMALWMSYLF